MIEPVPLLLRFPDVEVHGISLLAVGGGLLDQRSGLGVEGVPLLNPLLRPLVEVVAATPVFLGIGIRLLPLLP